MTPSLEDRGKFLKAQIVSRDAPTAVGSYLHNVFHSQLHNRLYWPLLRQAFGSEENWITKKCLIGFCGMGRESGLIRPFVSRLVAFDGNPDCVQTVQTLFKGDPGVQVFENDGFSLKELESNQFDMATALVALMHICSASVRKNYMKEFHRVLKPGGVFFFQEAGWTGWNDFEGERDYGYDGTGFPDTATLQQYVETFGFQVKMLVETPNPFGEGPNPWWWVGAHKVTP